MDTGYLATDYMADGYFVDLTTQSFEINCESILQTNIITIDIDTQESTLVYDSFIKPPVTINIGFIPPYSSFNLRDNLLDIKATSLVTFDSFIKPPQRLTINCSSNIIASMLISQTCNITTDSSLETTARLYGHTAILCDSSLITRAHNIDPIKAYLLQCCKDINSRLETLDGKILKSSENFITPEDIRPLFNKLNDEVIFHV